MPKRQPLVVAVHRDGQHFLGVLLADDVFIELRNDFARAGNAREELLGSAAATTFLIENRLAQLDALAADVNVARSFDQRADIAIALATERTEGVFLGRAAAAAVPPVRRPRLISRPLGMPAPFEFTLPSAKAGGQSRGNPKWSLEWRETLFAFRPGGPSLATSFD